MLKMYCEAFWSLFKQDFLDVLPQVCLQIKQHGCVIVMYLLQKSRNDYQV